MNIQKIDNNLVLTLPLSQKSYDALDNEIGEVPNLVGVISKDEFSISQSIDLGYCGKTQEGMPIIMFATKEELEKICKKFGLDIIEHEICAFCDDPIYGTFKVTDMGYQCSNCDLSDI